MSNPSTQAPARLGTRLRGRMAAAYEARGHSAGDLVLHYSAKMQMDVVLSSKLAYYHFLRVERDPTIAKVDYAPTERLVQLAGAAFASLVDAELETASGEIVWRRLIYEGPDTAENLQALHDAIGKGPLRSVSRLEVMTFHDLIADDIWTRNAHRALSWIAAVSAWPLGQHKAAILAHLKERAAASFQECLDLGEQREPAMYGAAVLQLALNAQIRSNLDSEPLTAVSRFAAWRGGR